MGRELLRNTTRGDTDAQTAEERNGGSRRVVVTGTGAVTPIGNDVPTFWSAMKEGGPG